MEGGDGADRVRHPERGGALQDVDVDQAPVAEDREIDGLAHVVTEPAQQGTGDPAHVELVEQAARPAHGFDPGR